MKHYITKRYYRNVMTEYQLFILEKIDDETDIETKEYLLKELTAVSNAMATTLREWDSGSFFNSGGFKALVYAGTTVLALNWEETHTWVSKSLSLAGGLTKLL
jgi:hypothetical protein